ncbi:MAG: glycosyltransferase, partial [Anaerolineales bacterium]|nr:glycosyltransferase [Anaerolineales bacterium]
MDGGSTDGSVEIIKKYEKYLAYWQSQPDGGQYQAINAGFKRSTGEIMGWLNSDDKLHSQSLFKVAYIFSTHFEVDWIEGLMAIWNKTGQLEWVEPSPKQWSRQDYLRGDYRWIQQESTFWRRSLWDKAGSVLDTSYKLAADLELWARFFRHGQLYRVVDVLGGFRRHGNQRSVLMIDQYVQEAECIIDRENALFQTGNEKTLLPGPQPLTLNQDKFKQFVAKTTLSKAIQPLSDKANLSLVLPKATSNYLVSAIVSTYNSERFIQGRLQNLVEQSLYQQGQLEIIVIDSNSPQQEGQIVQKFAAKYPYIKYHRTPKRETVYAAWNRGIELAEGRYIINANTDDRFAPDALERMAVELAQQVDLHAVYGDWLVTQTENDSFESPTNKFVFNYPNFYPPLLFYYQITSHAAMFRRDTFNLIGYFDGNFKVFGDRDLMFRFAIAGLKAKKLPVIVGLYLENPSSLERASETATKEFSLIRDRFRNPENLARLFGYEIVPDPTTMAQLWYYPWNSSAWPSGNSWG